MEEMLFHIEIYKKKDMYLGKIQSNVGCMRELKNYKIESLLRDLINDLQMIFDSVPNSQQYT